MSVTPILFHQISPVNILGRDLWWKLQATIFYSKHGTYIEMILCCMVKLALVMQTDEDQIPLDLQDFL